MHCALNVIFGIVSWLQTGPPTGVAAFL